MVVDITDVLWDYILRLDFWNFFVTLFNTYMPYGLFFWLVGLVIFFVIDLKSKNLGYAGAIACIYFVMISSIPNLIINAYSLTAMRLVGILIGLIASYYIYKDIKG